MWAKGQPPDSPCQLPCGWEKLESIGMAGDGGSLASAHSPGSMSALWISGCQAQRPAPWTSETQPAQLTLLFSVSYLDLSNCSSHPSLLIDQHLSTVN